MTEDVVRGALALTTDPREDIPDEELAELLAPDIVIDMSVRIFNPHVYEGFDGLRQYRVDLREVWDAVEFVPEELIEQEGDRVLVVSRMLGRGRASGLPIDESGAALYEFEDGRVKHVRFLGPIGRDEALEMVRAEADRR